MAQNRKITPAQQAVLARFTCERLTADPDNLQQTWDFRCRRNSHLANNLPFEAWYEDMEGRPAVYYLVKNEKGQIAMYFSLKCGVLFDPDYVQDVMERYERSKALLDALENRESEEWAREHIESLRSGNRFIPRWKASNIRSDFVQAKSAKRDVLDDQEKDPNEKLIRVDEAFPAIELVHFCVNDKIREEWKSYNMGHPIGECMFWHFVVPKMMEINNLIGCEYAYLFAADSTPDGTLLNYYETALHFARMEHIGAIKPEYDFFCTFMGARLSGLTPFRRNRLDKEMYESEDPLGLYDYRKMFFENFNLDPADELV